ncbi:hypothetical protein PACTADRAFT_73727 [Pachysolen tannophilus NRRL Y-2460]|uniref:Pseudouridine synthase I TruA alpha/beta domain-containing protein n=1 Tax=Pachysolen tannophilus NRRL Y-2460 TaxID=669874 RepID=A0A1E4U281_PACTA|nr:hypothetical protein PACTADRAFT_73727 [Pachysolen tannophilus NRRL Y-2460]
MSPYNKDRKEEIEYEKWTKKQLIKRILELENGSPPVPQNIAQNGPALKTLANDNDNGNGNVAITTENGQLKKKKVFNLEDHNSRLIALKFAYLGWNYQGLAFQKSETDLPTVEYQILKALNLTKMVSGIDPANCSFSRCGRTDKGVSAMNQVISLKVRSNLTPEEQKDPTNDSRELDYVNILNQVLPSDIKFHAVCLRPPVGFDARFSCKYRHYKYIFEKRNLDIKAMSIAASKFEGVHDFRNFCKIDGSKQITNFIREIFSAKIEKLKENDDDYYIFNLKGSAFLWHQVRCMMAILFSIGQKLEKPEIIDDLMNIEKFPKKPVYAMAHDIPLVYYDCEFDDVEWTTPLNVAKESRSNAGLRALKFDYNLKSLISNMMYDTSVKHRAELEDRITINNGDGKGRNSKVYVPLANRDSIDTPEVINEKWITKRKKRKLEDGEDDGNE